MEQRFSQLSLFFVAATFFAFVLPAAAQASITLLDKGQWKFSLGAVAELDAITDGTSSFTEMPGNAPVERSATLLGATGRTQFSARDSRISFSASAPTFDDWHTSGYVELDLLGYDPAPGSAAGNSEIAFFTNPTTRLRHYYLRIEKGVLQILFGQSWTLFGWQPYYFPSTVLVPPLAGSLYERTPQFTAITSFRFPTAFNLLQLGLSVTAPVQRDSQRPGLDGGVRLALSQVRAPYTTAESQEDLQPLSIGLSGTWRDFATPGAGGFGSNYLPAGAVAVNTLIPIIPSLSDGDRSGTLVAVGEFSMGTGFADQFPGWSGNLPQLLNSAKVPNQPNLDAGQAGLDGAGGVHLVHLQSWNAGLQYHFFDGVTYVNAGYGQLFSSNVGSLTPVTGKTSYDRAEVFYANVFHEFSKQLKLGVEFADCLTDYSDGIQASNARVQLSGWFRI